MEIERINDHTIKFYISYLDIEDRGFEREEIWYDRERSEQLFWQMIEEVNSKEADFVFEGPLWIQVQALEKGIEVIVTKSQVLKDENFNLPMLANQEKLENIFGKNLADSDLNILSEEVDQDLSIVVSFRDFEDVIQFSHYFSVAQDEYTDSLYHYDGKYYLYVTYNLATTEDDTVEDMLSQMLEFAEETDMSIHVLEEYGNKIFTNHAIREIKQYFPIQ